MTNWSLLEQRVVGDRAGTGSMREWSHLIRTKRGW